MAAWYHDAARQKRQFQRAKTSRVHRKDGTWRRRNLKAGSAETSACHSIARRCQTRPGMPTCARTHPRVNCGERRRCARGENRGERRKARYGPCRQG
eukprot:907862-Rhodomonas_salina.1